MKYALLLCVAVVTFDAMAMNGHYRNRVGRSITGASASVGQILWGRLSVTAGAP